MIHCAVNRQNNFILEYLLENWNFSINNYVDDVSNEKGFFEIPDDNHNGH